MSEALSSVDDAKSELSKYAYGLSVYFVGVGVLYLLGYWSTFDINILEYMGLGDIVKSTIYPIGAAFIFYLVGLVFAEFWVGEALPHGGGRDSPIGKILNRWFPIIKLLYVVAVTLIVVYGPPDKWKLVGPLAAIGIYLPAKNARFLETVIRNESVRSVVIYALATLPFFAFGHGQSVADRIVKGIQFDYVLSTIEGVESDEKGGALSLPRFIGHTGDFIFTLNPSDGSIAVSRFDGAKSLVLKRFKLVTPTETAASTATKPASSPK